MVNNPDNCPEECGHHNGHYCGESGTHCGDHCICPCAACEFERKNPGEAGPSGIRMLSGPVVAPDSEGNMVLIGL